MTALERPQLLPEDREVEDLAGELDAARDRVAALPPEARRAAEAMVEALDDAHRAALVHLVRGLRGDERGRELLFELVDDPAIRMVLLMHRIIRPDPTTLANEALAQIRPQIQSHGGDVELVRLEGGTAFVRLSGACNGCSMAAVTMRGGVETALKERVPGLVAVEVVPNEPGPALIQLSDMRRRATSAEDLRRDGWCVTRAIGDFDLATVTAVTLQPDAGPPVDVVVLNLGGQLAAYVNECAHMAMPLDDAVIDVTAGTLTCSWRGYCYDALSGECRTLPGAQLEQLPLRVEAGQVWVRPAGARA